VIKFIGGHMKPEKLWITKEQFDKILLMYVTSSERIRDTMWLLYINCTLKNKERFDNENE